METMERMEEEPQVNEWKHTLFGCYHDPSLCILVYFVPCYIAGKVSEKLQGSFLVGCICSLLPVIHVIRGAIVRQRIRDRQKIEGTLLEDLILWALCPFCTLAQEAQEIDAWSWSHGEKGQLIERQ